MLLNTTVVCKTVKANVYISRDENYIQLIFSNFLKYQIITYHLHSLNFLEQKPYNQNNHLFSSYKYLSSARRQLVTSHYVSLRNSAHALAYSLIEPRTSKLYHTLSHFIAVSDEQ